MNLYKVEVFLRTYQKRIAVTAAAIAVIVTAGLTVTGCEAQMRQKEAEMQKELAQEVLRFHVLANSDSDEDQALKLEVRDDVLAYMEEELQGKDSLEETKDWASSHEVELEERSEKKIREEGYDYSVHAEVTTCEFPEKTYGDVTFPAGTYEALRIEIGEAKGHNWWCCLYPNLCFIDATNAVLPEKGKEELKSVLTEDEYEMVTSTSKFKIKSFFFQKDR